MQWEKITSRELYEMVKEEVCIIPIGSLEKHGEHLPLGNDALIAHKLALMAVEKEPAVVLPPLYFAYTKAMKNLTGAISLETDVLLAFLENLCDEVARNGFKKIILLNAHGGNVSILGVFLRHVADKGKDYAVYLPPIFLAPEVIKEVKETSETGHAGEIETSISLYLFPELCKMERLPKEFYSSRRDYDVSPASTSIDWYAAYPDAYVGDARKANAEKGRRIVEAHVEKLVELIRKIKRDDKVLRKLKKFNEELKKPEPKARS